MPHSEAEYDVISPFALAVPTGNNNDVPESSLSSRAQGLRPGVNFDDDDECIIITDTPIDDGDLDSYVGSDFGSPSSLPKIRFMDKVPANAAGVAGSSAATTATTTITTITTTGRRRDSDRPLGIDWALPAPGQAYAYGEDAVSSANLTVASSPEVVANLNMPDGRSSPTTRSPFSTLFSTAPRIQPPREDDLSPFRLTPDLFSKDYATVCALNRPIAVGESAFSRRGRGFRAQEASPVGYIPFSDSIERQQRHTPDHATDHIMSRLGTGARPGHTSGASVVGDTTRSAPRPPAGYPHFRPLSDYTAGPPSSYGYRHGG